MTLTSLKPKAIGKALLMVLGLVLGLTYASYRVKQKEDGRNWAAAWEKDFRNKCEQAVKAAKELDELEEHDPVMQVARERYRALEPEKYLAQLKLSEGYRLLRTPRTDVDLDALSIRARLASQRGSSQAVSIETVDCDNSQVTDKGLAYLDGLDGIKTLLLDGCRITDAGLAKTLPNLGKLGLRNTQVTERGIDALKKERPKLNIIR
jgi:hypothetical protein